jgi:pyridoxamine 5'-phosphate oxidase-like protein
VPGVPAPVTGPPGPRPDALDFEAVLAHLRRRSFAVLGTADAHGRPHAAGVEYAVSRCGTHLYVMTRRHLTKAKNIATNPHVSFVVPLTRRILWALPPPCIQFRGTAEILDRRDADGIESFRGFVVGRKILDMYEEFERRGEIRVCFLRIRFGSVVSAYGVGQSLWSLVRRMESGLETVEVPAQYRGEE